jgi:hypothetical protein
MSAQKPQALAVTRRSWKVAVLLVFGVWRLEFSALAGIAALTVSEPAAINRRSAPVTSGVPFPMGALHTNTPLQLVDAQGQLIALQHRTTATWRDGSVKWALLDFQTDIAANETREFSLRWGADVPPGSVLTRPLLTEDTADALWINTGVIRFSVSKRRFGIFSDRLQQSLTLAKEFSNTVTRVLPPEGVVVEERGSRRVVVRVTGWIDDGETNKLVKYLVRVHAFAGSSDVVVEHSVAQLSASVKMLWVKDLSLTLATDSVNSPVAIGGAITHTGAIAQAPITLTQLKESAYSVRGAMPTNGLRASGWFRAGDTFVGVQDFWQQFPKAVTVSSNAIRIGLYPAEAEEPFDMDAGLAKTHRLLISLKPISAPQEKHRAFEQPLFAQAAPQWYCDSKVFGDLAPFDFDLFPDYETLTEASGDKFIKSMATGIRNWGDVYYGGPYKGKNSYMNLEYDVPHNFILQFARTGQRKYFDAARRMAQHQGDIDTNHKTGWQWKHSPRHTEIQAEFGHTFTRGLLENYYLTGNRSTFDAAVTLGNFFIKQIRNPREMGNERQIGWGLISLLPVYEATWDAKYLEAVRAAVDRLAAEQEPGGKFKIRWDNRIAFFNGIAATGFIYYERATGDPKAAEAALKTIRRTKGFYPEYAGRTLEALAWAYQRTHDPEYLDLLKLTYETTMEKVISWNVMELGAPTIFTVHTLPFLEQSGLITDGGTGRAATSRAPFRGAPAEAPDAFVTPAERGRLVAARRVPPPHALNLTAAQFATENGLHVHHVPAGEGDIWLKVDSTEPLQLALIRKGVWKAGATAALYDPAGHPVKEWKLPREGKIWQRDVFTVNPKSPGAYRLALRSTSVANVKSGSYVTWDVATSRAIPAVIQTPALAGLQLVTPYLFTMPRGDSDKIELELVGEGEGFKKAIVYDPEGHVAGTMEAFVDLGDTGRYTYKLSTAIPPRHRDGIWSISLQDVSMTKLTGLLPYFATSQQAFFRPDRN